MKIANWSKTPGCRYKSDGPYSGEELRDLIYGKLIVSMDANIPLVIDLDGTAGYASSFLEEVFGGLIRMGVFPELLDLYLEFISDEDPDLITEIKTYINDALKEKK